MMFASLWDVSPEVANVLWGVAFFVVLAAIAVELHDNGRRVNSEVLLGVAWAVFFYIGWRT